MCQCEDFPCCGHDAEESSNEQYRLERDSFGDGDDYDDGEEWEIEE